MAVLLQFNEQTSLTVQQLGENTGTIQLQSIGGKSPCFQCEYVLLIYIYRNRSRKFTPSPANIVEGKTSHMLR